MPARVCVRFAAVCCSRSELTEQIWLVHTSDSYGSVAAAAFEAAVKTVSVAPAVIEEEDDDDEETEVVRATVEIART